MALPQRRRARSRVPDVDQASARQRHAGVAAVMAEPGRRSTRSLTTRRQRPSCSPSSAGRRHQAEIGADAVAALLEAATAALRTGRRRRRPATPAERSTSAPIRRPSVGCCWSAPRPRPIGATSRRPSGRCHATCSSGAVADGDHRRGRGPAAPRQSPRCRVTWARLGASSTGPSSSSARPATIAGSPTPCGPGASPRCSAARCRRPRLPRRGDGDVPRGRRRAGPRLDAPEPGVGGVPGRRRRRRRAQLVEACQRFEELGDDTA